MGENAERKFNKQHKNPQTNRGILRPNLSQIGLTTRLPIKWPANITEVEINPNEPRSHTRSNWKIKKVSEKTELVKMMVHKAHKDDK